MNATSSKPEPIRIAVLDDYQDAALSLADWSVLDGRATVTIFNDHLADSAAVIERLQPFDVVCVMRERTPMTRTIIERLPKLRLIASTAFRNASIDLKAAEERGIQVVHTGYTSAPTIELTWALILGSARNLVAENASLRGGGWQQSVGDDIAGRTLGVLGLGNVGGAVAQIGNAFGMKVIAWSQNLTTERAAEVSATLVPRDELFQEADVVTIHLVLSADRSRFVKQGGEITSGVHYVAAAGHSPSHASILFTSGQEQFMHMGDIAHNPVTGLQHPDWTTVFDYEPAQAIKSRKTILDRVATDRVMVMGYHFPFPAIGHVVRYDTAYRWEPTQWAW